MTKAGLRYLKSPAYSQSSFRPKESEAKLKLKLMLEDIHGIGALYYWTSSAALASYSAYYVDYHGSLDYFRVVYEYYAARPALLFKL